MQKELNLKKHYPKKAVLDTKSIGIYMASLRERKKTKEEMVLLKRSVFRPWDNEIMRK
jgi:hypothetical protein